MSEIRRLFEARPMVVADPAILGGTTPAIRGTQVPVYEVGASKMAGATDKELLEEYPSLDEEKIELAVLYATTNPLRRRPRKASYIPKGAKIVDSKRVPRRSSLPLMRFLIGECFGQG